MARKKKEVITNDNCKYQTIASVDRNFLSYKIIHEYDNIVEARKEYANDMDKWKSDETHKDYHHFGIRKVEN